MVAASSDPQSPQNNPARLPLLPSERDNNGTAGPRRPKSRHVSSRYMSPSPSSSSVSLSRRSPSPVVSRNSNPATNTPVSGPNRSVSVDRRRPVKPGLSNASEVSAAMKLLVTSTRSLSVSFQGEAFSLPISKTKAAAAPRKGTPDRRRPASAVENSKPGDQHLWPGRTRKPNPLSRSLSLECTEEKRKVIGSGDVKRALKQSVIRESRRVSFDGRLGLDLGNTELLKGIQQYPDGKSVNESSVACDLTGSDADSVSSGSTNSGVQECGGVARGRNGPRGIAVSARFWQETNSRLRRLNDPGSPLSTSPAKMVVPMEFAQSKKFPSDSPLGSPRAMSSPVRGGVRPASPSKAMTSMGSSLARGMQSPSRVRSSVVGNISSNSGETPSVLSFAVDVRRGKVEENRLVDAHLLRLLYNRQMQWRFVNARTEATLVVQTNSAEKNLWNAWITISDLRDSVTKKRHRLQLLRQKLKLASILKGQITCLEHWASFDKDHSVSLLGAIEALKASTLRLPVVGGAISDVQSVKDAIGSAVDVMQAMASSIYSPLSKVEELNSLVAELAKVITKERALLERCKDFLSMLASLQVRYCSLRMHILQVNRVPTA
ncbi:QWRF motif-containing protein 2-like isoform X2 [Actinidia eriantha]|uniref:QWRF motif-containing protein 2-like isoform X2 n=1 Tax=Actinidia eriantha TaxID=165200 RepID=UPI0025880B56|nr:QWRF motif-containing protein 2-like isoform X2 [Actinidia eriantha]